VLNWYKIAVESAPERSHQGAGDLVLDPHYKILAVALKYVLKAKLSVSPVPVDLIPGGGCDALYFVNVVLSPSD
jgi:hypothetical protein